MDEHNDMEATSSGNERNVDRESPPATPGEKKKKTGSLIVSVIIGLGLLFFILYFFGFIGQDKIEPGKTAQMGADLPAPARTARASIENITEWYEAVGTIRPKTETTVGAQTTGRVVEVDVRSGDSVEPGQLLVVLDSREFSARVAQAEQGLESANARVSQAREAVAGARAEYDRAASEYNRYSRLVASGAASSQSFDQAKAAYLAAQAGLRRSQDGLSEAEAGVRRAEQQVEEAKVALSYNTIKATEEAQVVKRLVEPGDMAFPGKPLLVLQSNSLILEAQVREGLIHKVTPGTKMDVTIDSLNKKLQGTVTEVVPSADPQTRTFLVKVAVEAVPGLYPGMFGRLQVPVDERQVIVVPREAVRRIGQLEVARVEMAEGWRDVFVRTGRVIGDKIEILSGLSGNETVGLPAAK